MSYIRLSKVRFSFVSNVSFILYVIVQGLLILNVVYLVLYFSYVMVH